jgi:hypothetical protein
MTRVAKLWHRFDAHGIAGPLTVSSSPEFETETIGMRANFRPRARPRVASRPLLGTLSGSARRVALLLLGRPH